MTGSLARYAKNPAALLGLVLALTQVSFDFSSLLLIAAGVGIFVLLNQPVSQQWFASRGAR